jgi:outer membrane biosynthesis protein TonB
MIRTEKWFAAFSLGFALSIAGCGGSESKSVDPVMTSPSGASSPDPVVNLENQKAAEAAETEAKPAEAPKAEAKPAEAPKAEAKPAEAPKAEAKPAEAPKAEAKPADAPKLESPK